MSAIVVLLLASVIFLTAVLLAAALMLRGQWEKMGGAPNSADGQTPGVRKRRTS